MCEKSVRGTPALCHATVIVVKQAAQDVSPLDGPTLAPNLDPTDVVEIFGNLLRQLDVNDGEMGRPIHSVTSNS